MFDKLKTQFDADDRAVSPVIGVILMVAITVILAAVIASMTLGLGDSAQTAPQAKFDFEQSGTGASATVTVTHASGASIDPARVTVIADGDNAFTGSVGADGKISAGDSITVNAGSTDEVKVVWESEDGGTSSTLQTYEVQ